MTGTTLRLVTEADEPVVERPVRALANSAGGA